MSETITINVGNLSEVGQNILAAVVDGRLVIVIDPSQDLGLSSTGKMRGIGSTGGFAPFPGGLKGNIYVGKKA